MSFLSYFSRKKLDLSKRSPAVRSLIDRTLVYLRQRAAEDPNAEVRPAMLASAIGENEMLALTALAILEKAGITKPHFGWYCKETMHPLGESVEGERSEDNLRCDACGREHSIDAGEVSREIFFTLNPKALDEVKEAA